MDPRVTSPRAGADGEGARFLEVVGSVRAAGEEGGGTPLVAVADPSETTSVSPDAIPKSFSCASGAASSAIGFGGKPARTAKSRRGRPHARSGQHGYLSTRHRSMHSRCCRSASIPVASCIFVRSCASVASAETATVACPVGPLQNGDLSASGASRRHLNTTHRMRSVTIILLLTVRERACVRGDDDEVEERSSWRELLSRLSRSIHSLRLQRGA